MGSHSGMTPIDGALVLNNVTVATAQWCPIQLSHGNHCTIILDINLAICIREPHYTIACPPGHCLNSLIPIACKKYLSHLHDYALHHLLSHKLESLFLLVQSPSTTKTDLHMH